MVGNIIRQRRIELGMTQDELAQKLGYKSRSSINKIEMGANGISQSQIKDFAAAPIVLRFCLLKVFNMILHPMMRSWNMQGYLRTFRLKSNKT